MKAIIDTETSGFSITKNAVCEIGIIIVNDSFGIVHQQSWIIKPYTRPDSEELVSYKEDAMAIHGITMEEIEKGMDVISVISLLGDFLLRYGVTTLIGHNFKQFDFPRLEYLVDRFAGGTLQVYEIEDTLLMCREQLGLPCNKLSSVCDHFGIDHKDKHRALGDCLVTLEVYKILKGVAV